MTVFSQMVKSLAVVFLLQASCLLAFGYVHEGERRGQVSPSLTILKPVATDEEGLPALFSEGDGNETSAEQQGLYASQDEDNSDFPTTVAIEPSWLSEYEAAEDYLNNWDQENQSTDPALTVPSGEAMPSSLNQTQEEFSNVVYDTNGASDDLDERQYTEDNLFPSSEPEQYTTDSIETELDPFEIPPYTVEPHFEGEIELPPPDVQRTDEDESKYVTTVGGTDTWGDFDIDDFQGRQRVEEELAAEASREPMRVVHRSPAPWLQRDVSQVDQPRQLACQLELDRGLGPDEVSSWYYDSQQMRCLWFGYRGYGGNANRFASRAACEGYCIRDMENLCEAVQCSWTGTQCALVSDQPCIDSARAYGRDWRTKCPPDQPVCMSRRSTRIAPDIDFRSIPLECLQDKDNGSCERKNPSVMFHYDRERNDCMTFYFHDCGGNDNRFETKSDCMTHCSP